MNISSVCVHRDFIEWLWNNTTFFNEHRKSVKLFVQKARLKLIRAHIRHLMGFTSCLTVVKWKITGRNWFIFLNVLDSLSLARKQNCPMPDTYSPDHSSLTVLKLWVLTRVVKIAIKLCSRAAIECREESKNIEDLGHICLHFTEQRKESVAGTFRSFPSQDQGLRCDHRDLHFWVAWSLGPSFTRSLFMAFFGSKNKSGTPPDCSFDYREIIGLLPNKSICKQ